MCLVMKLFLGKMLFVLWIYRGGAVKVIEDDVFNTIFNSYEKRAYPGTETNPTVNVRHGLSIIRIDDYNADQNKLVLNVWLHNYWTDPRLNWTDKPDHVNVPITDIWTPDITLYNGKMEDFMPQQKANIVRDGSIMFITPTILETRSCESKGDNSIICSFKFGSWVYNGLQLNLTKNHAFVDLNDFEESDDFLLENATQTRNEMYYTCCFEPFVDITYTVHLTKKRGQLGSWFGI